MGKRRPARQRVPSKISPNYRRPLETGVKGERSDDPVMCGEPNDAPAVLVQADGMRVYGVRKGDRRWVTGDRVQQALDEGWFTLVIDEMERHVIGFLNTPTIDGRVVVAVEEDPSQLLIPILDGAETVGYATDLRVDRDVITIATSTPVGVDQVLSMNLDAPAMYPDKISGRLTALNIIDRFTWAWRIDEPDEDVVE